MTVGNSTVDLRAIRIANLTRERRRDLGVFEAYPGFWITHRRCEHCKGAGCCYHAWRGRDPDWCCECGGPGHSMVAHLPPGASARLGSRLARALFAERAA